MKRKCPKCDGTDLKLLWFNPARLGPAIWTCMGCSAQIKTVRSKFMKRLYVKIEKRVWSESS